MITVIIDFAEDLPADERKNYLHIIAGDFPAGYVDHEIAVDSGDEPQIMIQLAQDEITPEQEKYLNKFEYIREYNVREGTLQPETTLEPWQAEAIHEITENKPCIIPSNGDHTRFCTEPVHEYQWHKLHHYIDVEGTQPMYGGVTITQFAEDSTATQVQLSYNEVDDLLTILLQRRLAVAKESYENLQKMKQQEQPYIVQKDGDFLSDDNLSDLDDRPF